MLTREKLEELFEYDGNHLIWKVGRRKGKNAGGPSSDGYHIQVYINRKSYFEHRLIFFLKKGYWPIELDHKDRNGLNNKWSNLRECTHQQNQYNLSMRKDNTSGYKGVCWHKDAKKWVVHINFDGKMKHLGLFKNKEEAALVYSAAAKKYHGEYAVG